MAEGASGPVSVILPAGTSPNQTIKVRARDFGGVVPIRVRLTPESGNAITVDALTVQQVVEHLELTEVAVETASAASVHQDVMRASASWKEVVSDLKGGQVPEALKQFLENLQAPNHMKPEKALSAAVQRGE